MPKHKKRSYGSRTLLSSYQSHLTLSNRLQNKEMNIIVLQRPIHRRENVLHWHQSPTNSNIRVSGWLWRGRIWIRTITPEEAAPPENSICNSYTSGKTTLVLVQGHPDPSEGATSPWPTYTMPLELLAAPAPSHRPLLSGTTTVRGLRPSWRMTSCSSP